MDVEPTQLQGHLDAMILAVLTAQPAHGYEVIQLLASASGGVFDLPEGTIYPALHRLEKAGSLSSRWDVVDGRRRRIYQVTVTGTARLADRRSAWRSFAAAVDAVLSPGAPA